MMRKYCIIVLLLFLVKNVEANIVIPTDSLDVPLEASMTGEPSVYLPEIPILLPPSPEVAALMKFVETPIDHSTGVPEIDIPVYEVKVGNISLPVSLSYHASGIKVNDIASPVGLGWVVRAGGAISRQIVDVADGGISWNGYNEWMDYKSAEEFRAAINSINSKDLSPISYVNVIQGMYRDIEEIANKETIDSHSDRYLYSAGQYSGAFRYKYGTDEIYTVPYEPIQIKADNFQKFQIVDTKGNTYLFDARESTSSTTNTDLANSQEMGQYEMPPNKSKTDITAWRLSKIVSANKKDSIELVYFSDSYTSRTRSELLETGYDISLQEYWEVPNPNNPSGLLCYRLAQLPRYSDGKYFVTNNSYSYNTLNVSEIKVNGKKIVDFTYTYDRSDIRSTRLDRITVYLDDLVKEYILHHTYSGTNNLVSVNNNTKEIGLRLMLDKIEIKSSSSSNDSEFYTFNYNPLSLPDYYWTNDKNHRFSEDYWGYYNGANNTTLIPNYGYSVPAKYASNRNPNETYMKACILEEIHYPTGGKRKFEYEAHPMNAGGLRIKKIKDFSDEYTIDKEKEYVYVSRQGLTDPLSRGAVSYTREIFYFNNICNNPGWYEQMSTHKTFYSSDPRFDMEMINNSPALYYDVTEISKDKDANILGKTNYWYNEDAYRVNGYVYADGFVPFWIDRGPYKPLLEAKTDYKFGNGVYSKVREEIYNYETIAKDTFITGVKIVRLTSDVKLGGTRPMTTYWDFQNYISSNN